MKVLRPMLFSFFGLLLLTGCNQQKEAKEGLQIFTSIYPIQYIVEQIAGEEAIVQSVYPPGVDAHTYEPSSKEITKMANGDALIYLGAGMESFAETAAEALSAQEIYFIEIGNHAELFSVPQQADADEHEHDHQDDAHHHHGDVDPHIWLDPLRMIRMADIITAELSELHPEKAAFFRDNYAAFQTSMKELDQKFTTTLKTKQHKDIIVTHAAYGYWHERYGIEQIAINGLSSSDEPSQKELANIAAIAEEKDLQFVIFETNHSSRIATIIQEHIQAEPLFIHNLEVLTEEEIQQGKDYLSLMHENLQVLDQATK